MFCHIVPSTYLKSWKTTDNENSIFIFKKNELFCEGIQRNILNLKGTSFGKVNFYYLKLETCNLRIYDELFIPIIHFLEQDYIIEYKNNQITKNKPGIFRTVYISKREDLVVKRKKDCIKIKIKSLESIINNLWSDSQKKYIERFFSNELENNWNTFIEKINEIVITLNFPLETKKYIMLFITLQFFRDGSRIDIYMKQLISNFETTNYNKSNTQNEILIDTIYEFIHDYKHNNKNSINIIYNTFNNLVDSYWNYRFYFNNDCDFITSDNPIFIENFFNKEAIIFPIKPDICLILTKDKRDNVNIQYIDEPTKKQINKLIVKNSKQYVAFYENKIDCNQLK